MAHEFEPHPDTDVHGDTIEFAAIEQEQPERVCYEISSGLGVRLSSEIPSPIEIRIGQTTETSPLFLHRGAEFESLCEAKEIDPLASFVLIRRT